MSLYEVGIIKVCHEVDITYHLLLIDLTEDKAVNLIGNKLPDRYAEEFAWSPYQALAQFGNYKYVRQRLNNAVGNMNKIQLREKDIQVEAVLIGDKIHS